MFDIGFDMLEERAVLKISSRVCLESNIMTK